MIVSIQSASEARSNPWGAGYFPDVPVVTQDGKTLHFYSDLIKGRIVVISFVYTGCSDLCPITTARLAVVKDKLGDAVGRDIFFISISVDPEHDTPDLFKAFADGFGASAPGWQFLTGKPEDINAINAKFGDRSAGRGLGNHRNEILIGNDATGDWERDTAFNDIDQLAMTIRVMDAKWRGQDGSPHDRAAGGAGYYRISDQQGQALFKRVCATIGAKISHEPDI